MAEVVLKTSVSETLSLIKEATVDALNQKRLYFVGKENEIESIAERVASMLKQYLNSGNTKYLGFARVIVPLEEPEENETVPHIILEVVWSRVDLKKAIENLGILTGKEEEYEPISKDLAYRFYVGARVLDVKYLQKTDMKIEYIDGLSPNSSAFWKIMRYIERDYFRRYEGTATEYLLLNRKITSGKSIEIDKKAATNFYSLMTDFNRFITKMRDLFGDRYSNREIKALFERVKIEEINEIAPAILALSKRKTPTIYHVFLITPNKIYKVSIKYSEDYKKVFKGFATWSSSFLYKKFLSSMFVADKVKEIRDPEDI